MSIEILSRPARQFLSARLDRLQETLETFGQRVREGIATVIGGHIGDAIRDALGSVLGITRDFSRDVPDTHSHDPDPYARTQDEMPFEEPDPHWHEREPSQYAWPAPPPEEKPPSRWRGLLTGGLHMAGWWLQDKLVPRSGKAALGVAGVAGIAAVACLAGPVTAGLLTLGGAVVWLSGLHRITRHLAGAKES